MFLLVPAHPGCPGQSLESREMVVVVVTVAHMGQTGGLWTDDVQCKMRRVWGWPSTTTIHYHVTALRS